MSPHSNKKYVDHHPPVAGLDKQPDVSIHESHGHRDILSVRKHGVPIGPAFLDVAEDVVPSTESHEHGGGERWSRTYRPQFRPDE